MRSTLPLAIILGAAVVAAGLVVATRDTLPEPARSCEGASELSVVFGEPVEREGSIRAVPVHLENTADQMRTLRVSDWEVDVYRVTWTGRLASLGTQSTHVDFVEGYEGETLAPGERMLLGDVQLSDQARGELLLVGWALDGCGEARVRA